MGSPASSCVPTLADARRALAQHFGFADFRPDQRRVIASLLGGRDVLAILPTGAGKSVCFQVPALLADGLTLVVSPLVSLMQDQVGAARRRGLAAAALHSALGMDERERTLTALRHNRLRLLYTAPERLERLAEELVAIGCMPSLLAVDEAHCIAEWGHDFRPSYRRLGTLRHRLGRPQCIALTGSATPAVRDDIVAQLRLGAGRTTTGCDRHVASFDRPNLRFEVRTISGVRDRMASLATAIRSAGGAAIVYVPTRGLAETVASAVVCRGVRALPYHAGLTAGVRRATLDRFLAGEADAVVATSAFGMGIDKPDVRLVAHWTLPPTPESYYQEAGRAGRDGQPARCLLLYHHSDAELHRRQLEVTFPDRALVEAVWSDPRRAAGVPRNVLASIERLRHELKPAHRIVDWRPIDRRRRAALARIDAIDRYARTRRCHRATLLAYFGERLGRCAGCGRCDRRNPVQRLFSRLIHS
jgi:ATP-dependent DNA helicase RecQ